MRPIVWVRFEHGAERTKLWQALVDSGSDHILTPEWVAREIGVQPDPKRAIEVRIGGAPRPVHFADVNVQLYPPEIDPLDPDGSSDVTPLTWQAQVGFFMDWSDPPWMVVLGQCGFFDRFTVSMSRLAQRVAVAPRDDFDSRFPPRPTTRSPQRPPRLNP